MAKGFEESLKELEEIVNKLEASDISLDESVKLFENGMKLSKSCKKMLDNAQNKISVLEKNENGEMTEKEFETE